MANIRSEELDIGNVIAPSFRKTGGQLTLRVYRTSKISNDKHLQFEVKTPVNVNFRTIDTPEIEDIRLRKVPQLYEDTKQEIDKIDPGTARNVFVYGRAIFSILICAYLFVYFHRLSLSVVANDLAKEFQASASVIGLLGSVYFYCYAIMQFPAGLLSDSLGPRKIITVSMLVASAGSVLFGFAPNIAIAFVGRILVGVGVSCVFIPIMKIQSQWFKVREFALMTGITKGSGGIGVFAATWALALMVQHMGWRVSFMSIGVCTLVISALVWIFVRDRPADKGWPSIAQIENKEESTPVSQKIPLLEGARQVVSEKYFWALAMFFLFDYGIFFGFGALWAGPYLMDVYGITKAETGSILSMMAWGMILGSPLMSILSDNVFKSRKKPCMLSMAILVVQIIFLIKYPYNLSHLSLCIFFFVFAIFGSSPVVLGYTNAKELFPIEITGTSVGAANIFPFLGGAIFMPLMGHVLDSFPKTAPGQYPLEAYNVLLLIVLVSGVLALMSTFFMKETFPKK